MARPNKRKAGSERRLSKEIREDEAKKPKSEVEEEEDKKPIVAPIRRTLITRAPTPQLEPPDTRIINVTIKHQDGEETPVKIKRCTPFNQLMTNFYDEKNKEYGSLVFLFDGRGVRSHQTPQQLDMDDGDEIDAMMHQSGGSTLAFHVSRN